MAGLRVLLTGFGPFPDVPENPSAWLAETLAGQASPPELNGEFHAQTLPTEWQATALVPRLYATLQPHVMIHFGVSQRAQAFRVERSAFNRAAPRIDAIGALPAGSVIRPEGPDRVDTALPATALAAHLKSCGLPAVASRSAGSYVCNYLYYHSLDWARRQESACLVLFVHIPLSSGKSGPFSEEILLHGAHETLRFVLNFAREQRANEALIAQTLAARTPVLDAKEA
jgi:pyroglutamyl-peptidase